MVSLPEKEPSVTDSMHTSIDSYGSELYKNFKLNPDDDNNSSLVTESFDSMSSGKPTKRRLNEFENMAKKYKSVTTGFRQITRMGT